MDFGPSIASRKSNGVSSTDPVVGWGGAGGYVYQKAYLEFFTTKDKLKTILKNMEGKSTVQLQACNVGGEIFSSTDQRSVTAVTWGVFPHREIAQPTVVDTESFMIWKDEAFQLWFDEWRSLYQKGTVSYQLISKLHAELYLVNIIENDFVHGDIFQLFKF